MVNNPIKSQMNSLKNNIKDTGGVVATLMIYIEEYGLSQLFVPDKECVVSAT